MKKESTASYVVRLAATLLVITACVAALLAMVNSITAPRIDAINAEKTQTALSSVLPDAATAKEEAVKAGAALVEKVWKSDSGYAVQVTPAGFGGTITMMVGVGNDGKVLGISVINHTETAGLGAVAAAKTSKGEAFRAQFVGLGENLAVTKDGGVVDAISSATITSRAVTDGVNIATSYVASLG